MTQINLSFKCSMYVFETFLAGIHLCDEYLLSFQTLQGLTVAQVSFGVGIFRRENTISHHKREHVPTFSLERILERFCIVESFCIIFQISGSFGHDYANISVIIPWKRPVCKEMNNVVI